MPESQVARLVTSLGEVLANIVSHGGTSARAAPIEVLLETAQDEHAARATVTVSDSGLAFDPTGAPPPPMPASLEEAPIGGLGLVMIRRCSDWLRYRHEGGRNHLSFGTRWS